VKPGKWFVGKRSLWLLPFWFLSMRVEVGMSTDVIEDGPENRVDDSGWLNRNEDAKFDKLYERIMGLKREDYAVPAGTLRVEPVGDDKLGLDANLTQDDGMRWLATEHATGQLCDTLSKGLRSLGDELVRREQNELRAALIQKMLRLPDEERKFQIRTIQPNGRRLARAVVSDSYKPIDDNVLIDPMVDLISDQSKTWRALGGQITDVNTRIKYITREPQIRNIGPNHRDWFVGFMYKNSEVGQGFAQFQLFVFDSFCENGCVFGSKDLVHVKHMHRGTKITSDFGLIQEERIQRLELETIRESVAQATQTILGSDLATKVKALVEQNEARTLDGGADKVVQHIKNLSSQVGLSKGESEQVLAHWDSREPNAIGVSSAITKLAQHKGDYEGRSRLEVAGGKLLELPNNRWDSVMALAT